MTNPQGPSLLPSPAERALARELASIRADLERVKAGGRKPQLDASSIMGPLYVRDPATGELVGNIGVQPDGGVATIPVGGPPPPKPNPPTVIPVMAGVSVEWNGQWVGGVSTPSNFAFVAVHVGPTATFITDASNLYGTLTGPGSIPVVPWNGPAFVRLVGYNTSTPPVTGEASDTIGPVQPAQVVAQELLDGIVNEVNLANEAVSAVKVKLGAVGTAQMAGKAVTLSQMADGSVDASTLLPNAVTPSAIAPLAVEGDALAASSVTADAIAANAVEAGKVKANAITAAELAANAVATDELAANSVVAGKVAASAITSNELAANSVGANQLVAGSVQAGKIAAGAVTASTVAAGAITAGALAANSVTAGAIQAGAVTAQKLEAVLIIGSRFVAGTTAGTRAEMNASGFEAWKGSLRTFDVDAATGEVMMLGAYKTAASGTRLEIAAAGNPDEVRFYQGNVYAYLNAEVAPNNTAALVGRSQTTGGFLGAFGCYPTEAFISTQTSGGAPVAAVSVLTDAMNIWARSSINFFHRNSNGDVINASWLAHQRAGGGYAWLQATTSNSGWIFGPNYVFASDNAGNGSEIRAAGFSSASSETLKSNITEVDVPNDRTAWDLVEGAPTVDFGYIHDTPVPLDRPRGADGQVLTGTRRNPNVPDDVWAKMPTGHPDKFEEYELEWPAEVAASLSSAANVRRHRFPLAEDLAALDPSLVADHPNKPVDLRDMIGTLWDAVDMLIKRGRVLEAALADAIEGLKLPPRPQRGDVVEGVGAVVPGRSKRQIDPETGQPRNRRNDARPVTGRARGARGGSSIALRDRTIAPPPPMSGGELYTQNGSLYWLSATGETKRIG